MRAHTSAYVTGASSSTKSDAAQHSATHRSATHCDTARRSATQRDAAHTHASTLNLNFQCLGSRMLWHTVKHKGSVCFNTHVSTGSIEIESYHKYTAMKKAETAASIYVVPFIAVKIGQRKLRIVFNSVNLCCFDV